MAKEPNTNDPCPCGSGRKFKKCCMNKKPRKWSINVEFEKPATEIRIGDFSNGHIQGFDNGVPVRPEKVGFEIGYDREKKKKIINQIALDPNRITPSPEESLQKFDLVYAIDTNTRVASDKLLSVTCIVLCTLDHVSDEILDIRYGPFRALEFWNITDHPENVAWMKVIQFITQDSAYNTNSKIGIVVDSDLGNLSAYNARSMPIYSDFYLPENFELIYASAEVGKEEFFVNHLIALCEDMAKSLMTRILLNKDLNTCAEETNNEPYTHFKMWFHP